MEKTFNAHLMIITQNWSDECLAFPIILIFTIYKL